MAIEDDFYHNVIEAKCTEAVAQRCIKKVFLEISQNSQENTCARGVLKRDSGTGVSLRILRNF